MAADVERLDPDFTLASSSRKKESICVCDADIIVSRCACVCALDRSMEGFFLRVFMCLWSISRKFQRNFCNLHPV